MFLKSEGRALALSIKFDDLGAGVEGREPQTDAHRWEHLKVLQPTLKIDYSMHGSARIAYSYRKNAVIILVLFL